MDIRDLARNPQSTGSLRAIFWANLKDEAEVNDAARFGYYACLFICLTTFFAMLIGGTLLAALVDIFFFFMAGLGIRQHSRLAAVSAVGLFAVEKLVTLASGQVGFLTLVTLPMGLILLNAARAAYVAPQFPAIQQPMANPPAAEPQDWLARVERLAWSLWPRLQLAFKFYVAGMIVLFLVGMIVRRMGLVD